MATMVEADWSGGPWQSQHEYDMDGVKTIIGDIDGPDDGRFHYTAICEIDPNGSMSDARACANARLIAAAPDLFEALNALLATYDHFKGSTVSPTSVLGKARAALLRASPSSERKLEGGE